MKRIYSLALSEEVMAYVDEAAAKRGRSRSETVNRLLSEALALDSAERRQRELFDGVERLLRGGRLRFLPLPTPSMAWVEGTAEYRYRPTVRYTVELKGEGGALGELRVGLRSRSEQLKALLDGFFGLWARLDEARVGMKLWSYAGERYCRILLLPETTAGSAGIGEELGEYLHTLDDALNLYLQEGAEAVKLYYELHAGRFDF